jgi:hypothetical protein
MAGKDFEAVKAALKGNSPVHSDESPDSTEHLDSTENESTEYGSVPSDVLADVVGPDGFTPNEIHAREEGVNRYHDLGLTQIGLFELIKSDGDFKVLLKSKSDGHSIWWCLYCDVTTHIL